VFQDVGSTGTVVEELKPFTAIVARTENGWPSSPGMGKQIGYVQEAKVKRMQ
jgi:hypothetical protein